jgi:putative ABC transport system permease protein
VNVAWFGWLKRRRLDDDDFQDEIRAHLDMATADRVADGADRRSARLDSLKHFGNVTLTTEAARSAWTPRWIEAPRDWLNDARYAIRVLAKSPAFTLTVVTVLGLGIGLNATVFTLLKSLALSPLSGVDGSGRLGVVLNETRAGRREGLSYPDYKYLRDHDRAFTGLIGSALISVALGQGNRAQFVRSELVTGNYFQQLGVRAQLGRTLLPSDEVAPGQPAIVVLSDGLWRRNFGADPDIIGKTVHLNTFPMTVVGVAESSFHGTIVSFDIEVFAPITMVQQIGVSSLGDYVKSPAVLSDRHARLVMVLGRLRPNTTLASASAQMALLSAQLKRDSEISDVDRNVTVIPIWQSPYGAQTYMLPAVVVLSAMGALLLLLVCANIGGLVLVRGVSRRGELAVRLALGASRARVVRLLVVENVALAIPGSVLGLALTRIGMPFLWARASTATAPQRIFFNLSVDGFVVGFSVLAACLSAIVFGLMPAVRGSRIDLLTVIKEDLSPRGGARGRFRAALVVSQVAVSLLLLVGAGLVTRSLDAARNADTGFDARNVTSVAIDLGPNGYDETRGLTFFQQLLDRAGADQGVESASLAANAPMTMVDTAAQKMEIDGYVPRRDEDLAFLSNVVGPNYFRTLKIGLLSGREFERRDDAAAAQVAVVNETLARRFWGSATAAVGQRVRLGSGQWRTVIGVARDVKYARINEAPRPYVYVPLLQSYRSNMILHTRGAGGVDTLLEQARAQIRAMDKDLPILAARSLSQQTRSALSILEMAAAMLFRFGVAGTALAAMGIYGLVSYTVRQSTHEIGIRMALGAQSLSVVRTFLGRGLRLGAIGAAIGIVGALAVTRLLGSVLYGVSATDATAFARALAVVLGGVLLATLIPAWRAARTNPLAALRRS